MGFSKSLKKIAGHTIAPVFSLPAKGIEKLTGVDWKGQLAIGSGVGGVAGAYSKMRGGNAAGGVASAEEAASAPGSGSASAFNFGSMIPSVIGAAGDIYAADRYGQGQTSANQGNIASAREQMAFQERMSSTSHQREVADLKAAGLNPVLSANSGASTPVGSTPNIANAAPNYSGIASRSVASALEVLRMRKEFEEIDSRIRQNAANIRNTDTETRAKEPFAEIGKLLTEGVRKANKRKRSLSLTVDKMINAYGDGAASAWGYRTNSEEIERRNKMNVRRGFRHHLKGER